MTPSRRADHETIWLEPACCGENAETGRTWCQHNVYACEDGVPATRYVRADMADARERRLREALEIIAGQRQCVDNLMGNADIARAALSEVAPDA